jgi:fructoselysine-6-P-deglycase FrlB-like protein
MDPNGFRADIALVPHWLRHLADRLEEDLPPLAPTGRTMVLAMGSSRYAADPVVRLVRSRGQVCWLERASTALLPPPAPDLTVVAVSATGTSAEVLAAARTYAGHGRLVAVTNRPDSPLAAMADRVVLMHAGEETGGVACRSYRHTIAVLLALLAADVVPDLPSTCRAAAESSAHLLETTDGWLEQVSEALDGPHGAFTLAPVERLGSARQSALMLREGPRRMSYACETGDWSHVDVYLTKTYDYRALVFAGSVWDQPALDWLGERGSTYVGVGADLPGATATVRFPGEGDPWVALLTEALVGELVAARWW